MGGKKQQQTNKQKVKGHQHDNNPKVIACEDNKSWPWKFALVVLAIVAGVLHRNHVAFMFESDRHFSHLSDLEREMTFRTEMGLYYSYFKTLVSAPSMSEGLHEIMQDNVTEYGHTINTLKRFNLYPEVLLSGMFRIYSWFAHEYKWNTMQCWKTERGKGLESIVSCEGMGNQFYFYINHAFLLAGGLMSVMFLFGVLLSDSLFGGIVVVACFFFNHGEATRVQWTPPLRESFGYPVFAAQMLVVSYILKYRKTDTFWTVIVTCLTVFFMLFWQFAQFALTTQVIALFVTYTLDYLPLKTLQCITSALMVGFGIGFVLLFGNEMLLTSFFLSSLISVQVLVLLRPVLNRLKLRVLYVAVQLILFVGGSVGLKILIGNGLHIKDDAHIFEILASKFSHFHNFHTKLYTCAIEFGFMQKETITKLSETLALPAAICALLLVAFLLLRCELPYLIWRRPEPSLVDGHVVYNCVQMVLFTVMAVLIMRLKLFFTPHLILLTALLFSHKMHLAIGLGKETVRIGLCGILLAAMAFKGYGNLKHQWGIMGEYSNVPQENLFAWINTKTPKHAVFAGSMPTMANVKLSTGRPIVNHPHYEDDDLRDRTMKVYSIFSRQSHAQVMTTLKNLSINYLIFEYGWCAKGGQPGCSMPEIWDTVDKENRGKEPLCEKIQRGELGPFKIAYRNNVYKVLEILSTNI